MVLQLKSDRELDRVKGLKLVELWLTRNPLCDVFKDQASYIRSVSDSQDWKSNSYRNNSVTVCGCLSMMQDATKQDQLPVFVFKIGCKVTNHFAQELRMNAWTKQSQLIKTLTTCVFCEWNTVTRRYYLFFLSWRRRTSWLKYTISFLILSLCWGILKTP